jgi:hypothetical protein
MSTQLANNFCSACGSSIIETAIICPKCGSPTAKYVVTKGAAEKSKTTAVVLAIFLGIWSWLYTYKFNKNKFWVALTTYLAFSVVILIRGLFAAYQRDIGYYPTAEEAILWRTVAFAWLFTPVAFTIWAIVDNATKSSSWYQNYATRNRLNQTTQE